jgi:amphi-Trp domain-containing protein
MKGKLMKKQKFKYSDQQPLDTCVRQLEALLEGLKAGTLSLSQNGQKLWLRPGGAMDIELRADQTGERENLEIHLSWQRSTLHAVPRRVEDSPPKTVRNWQMSQNAVETRAVDEPSPVSVRNLDLSLDAASGAP